MTLQFFYLGVLLAVIFVVNFWVGRLFLKGAKHIAIGSQIIRSFVVMLIGVLALAFYFFAVFSGALLAKHMLPQNVADLAFLLGLFCGGAGMLLGVRQQRK